MAIFIPHIKGCDSEGKTYTWIKWDTIGKAPSIEQIEGQTEQSLGTILTSGATNQTITQPISIGTIQGIRTLGFGSGGSITSTTNDFFWDLSNRTYIKANPSLTTHGTEGLLLGVGEDPYELSPSILFKPAKTSPSTIPATITYDSQRHHLKGYVVIGNLVSGSKESGSLYIESHVVIGNPGSGTKESGSLYIEKSCNALYFNATSDVRAKTNVQHASFKALNIVKSLPIYTFNYKETGSPAIGLIAQDAAKISFGSDFSLVNNPTASGENGDYMTIKESKLVYILWKAIQEQQEQINYLTNLVRDLSKK